MRDHRLHRLSTLIQSRPGITLQQLMSDLEVSRATVKRDIEALRRDFDTPIVFDRFLDGYRIGPPEVGVGVRSAQLPGLWFSAEEALALLTAQHLLGDLEPHLLGPKLKPLTDKLNKLLASAGHTADEVNIRIKVAPAGKRRLGMDSFQTVAAATLKGKRLKFSHFNRQNGQRTEREISPQRMVHYRDNWYVDGWCHERNALRSFSIDAISACTVLEKKAQRVSAQEIADNLGSAYGIFGGKTKAWAKLRFTPERARWVSREVWHASQRSHTDADGYYTLEVPYADERELVGDILRFGPDVEVLAPVALRKTVHQALLNAVGSYLT